MSRNTDPSRFYGHIREKGKADVTCTRCNHGNAKRFGHFGKRRIQRWRCNSCKSTFCEPHAKVGTHYIAPEKAAQIIAMMMEGMSLRAISRLTDTDLKTKHGCVDLYVLVQFLSPPSDPSCYPSYGSRNFKPCLDSRRIAGICDIAKRKGVMPMQFITNKKEQGTVVVLDDTSFVDCTFTNCQIIYSGGDYAWTRTNFVNCQIALQGHAGRTAGLLQSFGWKPPQPGTVPAPPPTGAVN